MGSAHLKLSRISPVSAARQSGNWPAFVAIEAPSLARCCDFELSQTCGLLSADIVRRAIVDLGEEPEFRLFIHDDRKELRISLSRMRESYLSVAKSTEGSLSDSLWDRAALTVWAAHGRRFVDRSTAADWRPVFERALLSVWQGDVDEFLANLRIEVSTWDSDASILRSETTFMALEDKFRDLHLLRNAADGSIDLLAGGSWHSWRLAGGEYSTFARDIAYQARKLEIPSVQWQNYWPASSNAYVEGIVDALKQSAAMVSRLSWPLRSPGPPNQHLSGRFRVTESVDLQRMLVDEGTSVSRLTLLRVAAGSNIKSALSWAHERLSVLRTLRSTDPLASSYAHSDAFLESDDPLAFLVDVVERTTERASFLTNAAFIKDVIGVVL